MFRFISLFVSRHVYAFVTNTCITCYPGYKLALSTICLYPSMQLQQNQLSRNTHNKNIWLYPRTLFQLVSWSSHYLFQVAHHNLKKETESAKRIIQIFSLYFLRLTKPDVETTFNNSSFKMLLKCDDEIMLYWNKIGNYMQNYSPFVFDEIHFKYEILIFCSLNLKLMTDSSFALPIKRICSNNICFWKLCHGPLTHLGTSFFIFCDSALKEVYRTFKIGLMPLATLRSEQATPNYMQTDI